MEQKDFDIKKVKVYRTLEGTIFEFVAAIILIATWIAAVATRVFNGSDITAKYVVLVVISLAVIVMLANAYYPRRLNFGQELKNIRQVEIGIRMVRTLAVELAFLPLFMIAFTPEHDFAPIILFAILIVTVVVFKILLNKAK
ncbi:MAG: hypothetical protein IKW98_04915 [Prevotella sp.]|nr:hypothetical protein [Prevotella sp.]